MSFDQWNNQADVKDISNLGKQNTNTKGNFFTHLLPTAGGTLGGVGGGALLGSELGTALLPGIGTAAGGLLGALAGGFLGGSAGKVAENKIEGQSLGNGVLGQGVEQGVLSAGPLRLLKGVGTLAKTAPELATGATTLEDAINAAGNASAKSGLQNAAKNLVTQGEQAQGRVAGISAGTKIANKELTPQDTQAMLQTLQDEGIKTGNANNALRDIQDKLNQYGGQISGFFKTNNTPLSSSDVNNLGKEFLSSLKTSDPTINKQASILATDLKNNVNDTQSLWQFRKQLDTMIPDAKQGLDNTGAAKTIALKNMRQFITQKLGDVPGSANYHNLAEIKPFISAEAKRLNNPGGGIIGRIAASGPVQKTEAAVGKASTALGNTINNQASNPYGLAGVASRTLPLGVLQAGVANVAQQGSAQNTNTTGVESQPQTIEGALQDGQMSMGSSPYSQDALLSDISRDPRNADKYISTYESLAKIFSPPQGPSVSKPSAQQASLASSALDSIQKLNSLVQQNPDIVGRDATLGQGLPVVGGLIQRAAGTTDYHTQLNNIAQAILHLQTGAAFSKEEKQAVQANLPRLGDSPQDVQNKLNTLVGFLSPFLGNNSASSSPADLISALQGVQ